MGDILEKVSDPQTISLLYEYVTLAKLPELNNSQSERCEKILLLAEKNEHIDFLINEVEHLIGHELGLLDTKMIKNSQALLRERLGTDIPELAGISFGNTNCPTSLIV